MCRQAGTEQVIGVRKYPAGLQDRTKVERRTEPRIPVRYVPFQELWTIELMIRRIHMRYLEELKKWLGEITEIALLLLALGIVVEILFGEAVPFFGGIVLNLTKLLNTLGQNGLVGLIALAIILFLFYRKKATV
jgi:hypothetical protein